MKDWEILDSNSLIAAFMGAEYFEDGNYWRDSKSSMRHMLDNAKDLHFHSSWDWLMPVVEKIEPTYSPKHGYFGVHISSNQCTIQGTKGMNDPASSLIRYSDQHYALTKIEAVYSAVIAFIKWYTAQQIHDLESKPNKTSDDFKEISE